LQNDPPASTARGAQSDLYVGAAQFEGAAGDRRIVLHPVVASLADLPEKLEYRIDGDLLLIRVAEGKHQGTYKYQRAQQQ
jgi:hypothetical protein